MCKKIAFACLETADQAVVPLQSISAEIDVQNAVAQITLTQVFRNNESVPIEAHFKFPIEDGILVSGMSVRVGERTIKGVVKEKTVAEDDYSDAIASGDGGYLLKQSEDSRTILEMAVGNLAPEQEAVVTVTFVGEVSVQDHNWRLVLPVANPVRSRDATSSIPHTVSTTASTRSGGLQKYAEFPYTFEASVNMRMSTAIANLECANFDTNSSIAEDSLSALVQLKEPVVPAHDFVLTWRTESMFEVPQFCIQSNPETQKLALAVNFVTNMPESDSPNQSNTNGDDYTKPKFEFNFIVDRSGSMDGDRMRIAIDTLVLFLKSLPEDSIFNIVSFGSSFTQLFPSGPVPYSDENVEKAIKDVQRFSADMGGTQIYEPLESVFKSRLAHGYQRVLFALTDGAVDRTDSVIDLVRKNCNKQGARLFAFGLGSGASVQLVNGIAEAGHGTAEYAVENERIQPKVISSLKRATSRCYDSWTVTWAPELGVTHVPAQSQKVARAIYDQELFTVYAFIEPKSDLVHATVRLQARKDNKEVEIQVPVHFRTVSQGVSIHKLAAKSILDQMDEGPDRTAFAVQHQLLCESTAFIAIEHRDTPVTDTMETRAVPTVEAGVRRVSTTQHVPKPVSSSTHHQLNQMVAIAQQTLSMASCNMSLSAAGLDVCSAPPPMKSQKKKKSAGGGAGGGGGFFSRLFGSKKTSSSSSSAPMPRAAPMAAAACPPPPPGAPAAAAMAAPPMYERERRSLAKKREDVDVMMDLHCAFDSCGPTEEEASCEDDEALCERLDRLKASESENESQPQASPVTGVSPVDLFEGLIQSQKIAGYWQLNSDLARLLGKSVQDLEQGQQSLPSGLLESTSEASNIWATCLAIAAFQSQLSSQQGEWELLASKARKWLAKHRTQDQVNELVAHAEKFIAN
eukprot:GILK01001694.1.p1 GENE.GILK01001694.1~~GILK01001694.1.p1  ORF type:complete len:912 (-),score=168.70 GILK01001694.1:111-2846(-)